MGSATNSFLLALVLFYLCLQCHGVDLAVAEETRRLYIVYMGDKQHEDPNVVTSLHHDTLASALGSKDAALGSMVYSYRHGFSGFAAMLTESQAKKVAELAGVVLVKPSKNIRLCTTRSWDFLGLTSNPPSQLLNRTNSGDGIIIGVVDTGIWPESKSFNDDGYGPVPSRWKGICQTGKAFNISNCNRKIIGARWYAGGIPENILRDEYLSPRDLHGHGTYTASTAAGSPVENASFRGLAVGLARGGAPRAMIAVYKIGWGTGRNATGNDASLLKAFDDAIHDGVDVLSLSLRLEEDSFGSLHAVESGITVVYAGGNTGPAAQTVLNRSPWVITVAASTIDRSFPTSITLGNNQTLVGQALYYDGLGKVRDEFKELFYGGRCDTGTLNSTLVRGKVVLCTSFNDPVPDIRFVTALDSIYSAGGVGLIFAQYTTNIVSDKVGIIPSIIVDFDVYQQILYYIENKSSPMVKLSTTRTVFGSRVLSPRVAAFSSRGPSSVFPGVLKPDIAAPGVSILAARGDLYAIGSGTSAAAPHVSGIAALLKSQHPNWSPAAIKSSIVTTASVTDDYGMPIMAEGLPRKLADPFDYGGGHINPERATDPGLIYDIDPKEYREFHCSWKDVLVCDTPQRPVYHLNLPSISIPDLKTNITVWRTVTNVGNLNSIYRVIVESPTGVMMEVQPSTLVFDGKKKKRRFKVTFTSVRRVQGVFTFGSLTWSDGNTHRVRIPIAVRNVIQDYYADTA